MKIAITTREREGSKTKQQDNVTSAERTSGVNTCKPDVKGIAVADLSVVFPHHQSADPHVIAFPRGNRRER